MRIAALVIILTFYLCNLAYGGKVTYAEALKFAKEYENELKAKLRPETEKEDFWKTEINIKSGKANYEEKYQAVNSDWDAFYAEVEANLARQSENDFEATLSFSYGKSATERENWREDGEIFQINDLTLSRTNLKGSLGKILYLDRYKDLFVTPFLGYGYRFINFERTKFKIFDIENGIPNIITSNEVVTERYYIHHLDAGIKLDKKLSSKWQLSGAGSFGYVIYNQADNSALGKIDGKGGYLVEGSINLEYFLSDFWQIFLGGSIELENLKGGKKADIIWPDNELNIYGGRIGIRHSF